MPNRKTVVCCVAGALLALLSMSCDRRTDALPKRQPEMAASGTAAEIAWGEAVNGLQAGLAVTGVEDANIHFLLAVRNAGTTPIRILSMPAAGRYGYCPFWLEIRVGDRELEWRGEVSLPRRRTQLDEYVYLRPGEESSVEWSVPLELWGIVAPCEAFATLAFGGQPEGVTALDPATGKNVRVTGLWTGEARSTPVEFEVPPAGGVGEAAAAVFVNGIEALKKRGISVRSLQEYGERYTPPGSRR